MNLALLSLDFSFPLENPVLKYLVVLIIILAAPMLLNKIKVPHLIGLIIAGAIIGPNGFNVLQRDSNIVVTGTTGLLYIMFLAGLEIDLPEFKKNKWKSLGFGIYTFALPLAIGALLGHYVLNFSWLTSLLFASLFSTHTLISYPLLGKLGIVKNRAVNITVGGTMITDILALLILAIVVGTTQGEVNTAFWVKLITSFVIFGIVVLWGFPLLGRFFFKHEGDKISQYIFVLVVIYLAALMAELAGVEAIIGAFFAGLALNRLIPHTSALMNRIDFVGNAIFIPFFLISVGMLIDFKVFFKDFETIKVVLVMSFAAILSKYIAAYFTQKTFNYTKSERGLIFGLSASHAAATLAVVLVGYNIIIGETDTGEPIRLLNESVLNGSIVLILISCTLSSILTQKHGEKIKQAENLSTLSESDPTKERILMAVNYENSVESLTNLALTLKSKKNTENIFALNVINNNSQDASFEKTAEQLLENVAKIGAASDTHINTKIRFDSDVQNGINNAIKENKITDLLLSIDNERGFTPSFTYNLYSGYIHNNNVNVYIYNELQPISTITRHLVIMPHNAHREPGFFHAMSKIWNISRNSGATFTFYGQEETLLMLERIKEKIDIRAKFVEFNNWSNITSIITEIKENEGLILIMSDRGRISHDYYMNEVPNMLNRFYKKINYLLIFPFGNVESLEYNERNVNNPNEFAEIGKIISRIFNQ